MNEHLHHDFGPDAVEVHESVGEQTVSSPTADRQGMAVPVVVAQTRGSATPAPVAARSVEAILTLADVIVYLLACPDLTPTQKRDWVCAIRSLGFRCVEVLGSSLSLCRAAHAARPKRSATKARWAGMSSAGTART
jgi:hypothetical protein